MVYIKNTDTFTEIPNTLGYVYSENDVYNLKIYNKSTNITKVVDIEGTDILTNKYVIRLPLPQDHTILFAADGEYNYFLLDHDGMVIEYGLVIYGDYKPNTEAYNNIRIRKEYNG